MAATLFVVATPIGNLEDITLRALRVLREVDVVAAEDTRRTGNLLRHYEIKAPLVSLHAHNEASRIPQLLDRLRAGESIALVTDAGTPGISDPGAVVVRAVRGAGLPVVAIPGPSAVTTALSGSGTRGASFRFLGFPPYRVKARIAWLEAIRHSPDITILFEAPHRIRATLAALANILGEQPIILARELTKVHEEWLEGSASSVGARLTTAQGEFVILVPPTEPAETVTEQPSDEEVGRLFGQIPECETTDKRTAIKELASRLGLAPNAVYRALERLRKLAK